MNNKSNNMLRHHLFLRIIACIAFAFSVILVDCVSVKAQTLNEVLEGTWVVKDWYCNNFLNSNESRCSNDNSDVVGKKYSIRFINGIGEIKRGDYYYPFDMIIEREHVTLAIDMKMMVDSWHIVELDINKIRVLFFDSEISFQDGSQSFNGDFNYVTLVKED